MAAAWYAVRSWRCAFSASPAKTCIPCLPRKDFEGVWCMAGCSPGLEHTYMSCWAMWNGGSSCDVECDGPVLYLLGAAQAPRLLLSCHAPSADVSVNCCRRGA